MQRSSVSMPFCWQAEGSEPVRFTEAQPSSLTSLCPPGLAPKYVPEPGDQVCAVHILSPHTGLPSNN